MNFNELLSSFQSSKRRFLKDRDIQGVPFLPSGSGAMAQAKANDYDVSLDKIVTEYLRKQHALCPQPISTCPTMSLFL